MFDVCLSAGDADWYYEEESHSSRHVDSEDRVCCECGDVIRAGSECDMFEGKRPDSEGGDVEVFHTCVACQRIWDSLAHGDKMFGGLNDLVYDAYHLSLDEVPDGTDSDTSPMSDGCCWTRCEFLTVNGGEAWCSGWNVRLICPERKATACGPCKAGEDPPIHR